MNLKNTSLTLFALCLFISAIGYQENQKAKNVIVETSTPLSKDRSLTLSHTTKGSKLKSKPNKQAPLYNVTLSNETLSTVSLSTVALLRIPLPSAAMTLAQLEKQSLNKNNILECSTKNISELIHLEKVGFFYANAHLSDEANKLNPNLAIKVISQITNTQDIDQNHIVMPTVEVEAGELYQNRITLLTPALEKIHQDKVKVQHKFNKTYKAKRHTQLTQDNVANNNFGIKKIIKKESPSIAHIGYWQTVYSIESKQGKLLYRPRNKSRNCNLTSGPCGHHQLTVQALKDIGCDSLQCRKDRLNYEKSLLLSKKLLALNEKRLRKNGITKLQGYKKYLIHQQGANGIKNIIAATQGKKVLSKTIQKNMANNSPYSYRQLKNMGSKVAAQKFLKHWENKWLSEKRLIVASQITKPNIDQIKPDSIPVFDDNEIRLALNFKF